MCARMLLIVLLGILLAAVPMAAEPRPAPQGVPAATDRDAWQKPQAVVDWLKLRRGAVVADLGAGSGYFTFPLAEAVGPRGIVYAVDVDPDGLRHIHKDPRRTGGNVTTVLCAENDSMLPDHSCDVIFICDTYHHLTDRVQYLQRLRRKLRPGGRIVSVDFHKKAMPIGPPVPHKLEQEIAEREAREAGYNVAANTTLLEYQYILTFTPPKSRRGERRLYGADWFREPPTPRRRTH